MMAQTSQCLSLPHSSTLAYDPVGLTTHTKSCLALEAKVEVKYTLGTYEGKEQIWEPAGQKSHAWVLASSPMTLVALAMVFDFQGICKMGSLYGPVWMWGYENSSEKPE